MIRTIEKTPTNEELRELLRETQEYADRVLARGNLAEKLEPYFESTPKMAGEGKTLASYVSDLLIPVMPRISPELFELKREANVPLTDKQREEIVKSFFERGFHYKDCNRREEFLRDLEGAGVKLCGKVPLFFYGQHDDGMVTGITLNPEIFFNKKIVPTNSWSGLSLCYIDYRETHRENIVSFNPEREIKDTGIFSLDFQINWKAPYKLNVSAKIPKVPEGFIELGDEAIATYYDFARKVPNELRKRTSLQPPSIGILWAPTDESLYATGKIPGPTRVPLPKHDPALILDIPDVNRNYRHVIATWDIGEELPFRNWITEYMETNGRPNLRVLGRGNS